MKKILNIAFAASLAVGGGALSSCADFLEADNKSNIEANDYFSGDGIEGLRVYTYSLLKPIVTATNLYERGVDLYIGSHGKSANDFDRYSTLTPQDGEVTDLYTDCYAMINSANAMIYYNAGGDGKIDAEAKFFRNYAYYILTQQFGAVPYSTSYIQSPERNYPRVELSELYPLMIAELEGIMNDSNLPAEDNAHEGYISQRAVKALLAKVCLAAGWDLGTSLKSNDADGAASGAYNVNDRSYFEKARDYALDAINGQQLTMSFEDKWSPNNEGNAEEIFTVNYERDGFTGNLSEGGHGFQNFYGEYYGSNDTGNKYCTAERAPSHKALYLWQEGDDRFDGTFMNRIYNYDGTWSTTGYYAYYNSVEKLATMPYNYRYFPYYMTEADVEAEIAANPVHYTKGKYFSDIYAYILSDPIVEYKFAADGTYTKSTETYSSALTRVGTSTTVKKFDDPKTTVAQTNTSNGYRNIVVFHLSDMYLTAAEAYLMNDQEAEALQYVNAVRARSHATTLNSFADYNPEYSIPGTFGSLTELDVILDERARELYAEGTRWMDLRRTRQLVRYNVAFNSEVSSVDGMCNARGEVKWYRPIPSEELSNNDAMTSDSQNPGY